jgi:transposase-like protein
MKHTPEDKARLLDEWRASNLSGARFGKEKGVDPSQLYRWRIESAPKREDTRTPEQRTAAAKKRYTREQSADLIRRWRESGLSAPKFAARNGMHATTLYDQRRKLQRRLFLEEHSLPGSGLARSGKMNGAPEPAKGAPALETSPPGKLRCPCCGCDIAQELMTLALKLKALENV